MKTRDEHQGGLAEKTKDELIQIILRKDATEQQSSKRIKELEKCIPQGDGCSSDYTKKTSFKSLFAALVGALIATALIFAFNRPWISDDTGDDAESVQKENNIRERVHAYFDEHDIPYETIDSIATRFTYNDISYIFVYDSIADDEIMYIWAYIPYEDNLSEKELIEKMNIALYTQVYFKFIKVDMDVDRNLFKYTIEQYIDQNMDINALLDRMISALNNGVFLYYYDDDYKLSTGNNDTTQL